jgi:arylsulfatase A-like enzyme
LENTKINFSSSTTFLVPALLFYLDPLGIKYSAVCAPARTTIRTGCTIERTGIQHNDLITEYTNGPWFQQRVENLVGLDHVLVQKAGYLSEYYGKWHLPDKLWYSHPSFDTSNNATTNGNNIIHYNDYDYTQN